MFAIGLGVGKIRAALPNLVYALLSGLNGATVSLIALAGVQLAERAINSKMTLLLVGGTACLALLYRGILFYYIV
jgi:chromate transport protein ChrA